MSDLVSVLARAMQQQQQQQAPMPPYGLQRALANPPSQSLRDPNRELPGDWTDRLPQSRPYYGITQGDRQMAVPPQEPMMDRGMEHSTNELPWPGSDPTWTQRAQATMPMSGALPGTPYLDPSLAPRVKEGAPRPLAPGEYVQNPDGGWSSEMTMTVTDPALNAGKPTVLPSLWVVDGRPTAVDEATAAQYAVQSGLPFRSFADLKAAEAFAQAREADWQSISPQDARLVPSLWGSEGDYKGYDEYRALRDRLNKVIKTLRGS